MDELMWTCTMVPSVEGETFNVSDIEECICKPFENLQWNVKENEITFSYRVNLDLPNDYNACVEICSYVRKMLNHNGYSIRQTLDYPHFEMEG